MTRQVTYSQASKTWDSGFKQSRLIAQVLPLLIQCLLMPQQKTLVCISIGPNFTLRPIRSNRQFDVVKLPHWTATGV